jgi:putative ABC transport system ATP-binding protein
VAEGAKPDPPALCGRRLSHTFGEGKEGVRALDDVSLNLYAGEVALLRGPSGSGKTTLLDVLSGLLRPTAGRVVALGQDLWAMSERQRERFRMRHCGFVFQEANLLPALTARQQLEMVLRWAVATSAREARRRTDAMLDLLGLARKGHLRSAELSGGEKQRVAVGRALVKEPTFCFADEPTSALDWSRGEVVVRALRDAARQHGRAVLVVSHDVRVADYADRVLDIADGRLVDGPRSGRPGLAERAVEATARLLASTDRAKGRRGRRTRWVTTVCTTGHGPGAAAEATANE